jgi:protein-disulfide isomerase
MKRLGVALVSSLLAATLSSCQKDDSAVVKKLDELVTLQREANAKLDRMASAPGAARPAMPPGQQAGRPDPTAVYAVPIEGAPFKGAKNAKVTIVEAFEFA